MSKMEDRLVYMANQIGKAFVLRPRDEAIDEIATHIKAFWEKRMLTRIFAHIDAGGAGLDELPKQSLLKLRETLPK
ncbi:formate dehydrogenase subunit delta [Acidocella sp.]|jgi:formate dehydrogenase subunit delta|uniref:formate dehydrogenase subunit delta n=1 Tax=Acidocella sp. TaxID=50710 RepID=UPI002F3FF318